MQQHGWSVQAHKNGGRDMQVKERTVWRVQSGGITRWFAGELGARDYASDRFEAEFDGVPFVEQILMSEMLAHINELEMGRKTFMDFYGKDLSNASK
jgi:hypothetical protein